MLEVFLSLAIFGLIVLGFYVVVFLLLWQGAYFIERLKRDEEEDWEA